MIGEMPVPELSDAINPTPTAIQCPLDIATLDIAAALPIATSNPIELGDLALHK